MIHYHQLGDVPPKHHVTHRHDGKLLMEQCMTRAGFDSTYSTLYYKIPPTDECAIAEMELPGFCPIAPIAKQPLHRRHLRTQDLAVAGDFLTARRTILLNDDVRVGICKPNKPARDFFSNSDGDECWFAYAGGGVLESVYGSLPFKKHDYVIIPQEHALPIALAKTIRAFFWCLSRAATSTCPSSFATPPVRSRWTRLTVIAIFAIPRSCFRSTRADTARGPTR